MLCLLAVASLLGWCAVAVEAGILPLEPARLSC